jgi:hypothetical protein
VRWLKAYVLDAMQEELVLPICAGQFDWVCQWRQIFVARFGGLVPLDGAKFAFSLPQMGQRLDIGGLIFCEAL